MPCAMLSTKVSVIIAIEPPAIQQPGIKDGSLHAFAKVPAQPLTHRRPETHFTAIDDLIGNPPGDCLLQEVLGDAATHLVAHRNAARELDQVVVQKWHTRLDACGHSDLVDPHQKEFRQTQFELVIDHARECIWVCLRAQQ